MITLSTFERTSVAGVPTWMGTLPGGRSITIEKHNEDLDLGYYYRVLIQGAEAFKGWFDGFDTGPQSLETTINAYFDKGETLSTLR